MAFFRTAEEPKKDENRSKKENRNNINSKEKIEWISLGSRIWQPHAGDMIEGTLIEKKSNLGKYEQQLYIIETPEGEKIEVWGTVQLNKMMEKVYVDDYIRVTFNGTCKTRTNKQMNLYNIQIKR